MEGEKYLIAFMRCPEIGPVRLKKIFDYFKDPASAYYASSDDLYKAGLCEKIIASFLSCKMEIDIESEYALLKDFGIKMLTIYDKEYPQMLKEIHNPPFALFYLGNIELLKEKKLAVVGSRHNTNYGQAATKEIVKELARYNICVVSGMAFGIDSIAHNSAIENQGNTIAVLGSGIDRKSFHPKSNIQTYNNILQNNGLIISELLPLSPIFKHNFVMRNRIIAGISSGTLVTEACEKSGSLITAKYALEQNRDVYAVPGNIISKTSQGTNNLIKQGAKPVTDINDILENFDISQIKSVKKEIKIKFSTPIHEKIYNSLSYTPVNINDIIRETNLPAAALNSILMEMELNGSVKNIGGMRFIRISNDES